MRRGPSASAPKRWAPRSCCTTARARTARRSPAASPISAARRWCRPAGIALAVKARAPDARLYTAEPQGFDDHARSFRTGRREVNEAPSGSICDALMSLTPGRITFEINRALVGEGLVASDQEVAEAVAFSFREPKRAVEPGGALAH